MADTLTITSTDTATQYAELLPQLTALVAGEPDTVANLGNIAAALHQTFGWHWVGFYIVKGDALVLGPFQGPIACTRIAHGKGVCGAAWASATPVLVDDVGAYPGHIACSSLSRAELVVPVLHPDTGQVLAVLDADATTLAAFTQADVTGLQAVCTLVAALLSSK